jgi:uroporphyrin-III C-methyltransferase
MTRPNKPQLKEGSVWLVGAGPGDPGLLTLLALEAIEQADVVVYDALVSEQVLAMVGSSTTLIYAGKRGGRPSSKQPDISDLLVELANNGKRIS